MSNPLPVFVKEAAALYLLCGEDKKGWQKGI